MDSELRQSVKEYRKIWEDSGVEFFSAGPWTLTRRAAPAAVPAPEVRTPAPCRLFYGKATSAGLCRVLFVGSAEGFTEEAGQLLGKIIDAMALGRETAPYLADERFEGSEFLKEQIRASGASVVVALGPEAASALLGKPVDTVSLRGKWHAFPWVKDVAIRATFHPAHLLQTPSAKKEVWEDMKLVLQKLAGASK